MDEKTEVEGVPVRFDQLAIAPTSTVLQYSVQHRPKKPRVEIVNFDNLSVNGKRVKADRHGSLHLYMDQEWTTYEAHFDPHFGTKPKEVNIQFQSVHLTYEDRKTIELNADKEYPQTFEYAGSTISIDKVEVGQPATLVISNHEIENRAFESLHFDVLGENEDIPGSMSMDSDGILVDKNGNEIDVNDQSFSYEELEQPRYFTTVQSMRLEGMTYGEKVIPKRLDIYGYNTTKYLDTIVNVSIDK